MHFKLYIYIYIYIPIFRFCSFIIKKKKTSIVPLNGIWYIGLDRTSNYPILCLVDNVLN